MSTEFIDIVIREKGTAAARQGIEAIGTAADTAARKVSALQSVLGKFTKTSFPSTGGGGSGGGGGTTILPTPNRTQVDNLRALLSTLGGTAIISGIARMANSYQNMTRTISQFETAARPTTSIMRDLFDLANDTAQAADATVQSYSRLRIATKDLGIAHEELIPIQRTVQQLVALSTSSTQSANAAMYQFSQALASGRLQGDEFRSVMENAPRLATALAEGMGKPTNALKQMSQEGELTSDKLILALEKVRDKTAKEFATLTLGPSQQLTRLMNNFEQALGIIAQKSGAMAVVAQVFNAMANSVTILAPLLIGVATNLGVLLIRSRAVAETFAMFGLTGSTAMGLLKGPIGWAITAVGTLILLFDKYQGAVITAGEKSATLGQIWQGLKNVFFDAMTNIGKWASEAADTLWTSFATASVFVGKIVKDAINGVIKEIIMFGVAIGVYVGAVPDMFKAAFNSSVDWVLQAIDRMTAGVASGVNTMRDILNKLPGVNIQGTMEGTNLKTSSMNGLNTVSDVLKTANATFDQIDKQVAGTDYVGAGANMAKNAVEAVKSALIDLADKGTTATDAVTKGVSAMGNALDDAAKKLTELQKLGQMFDKWGEPFAQAGSALTTLSELLKNGIIDQEKMATSIEKVREAFLRAGGTAKQWGQLILDNVDETGKKMQEWAVGGVKSLGDAFVDLALTGKASFGDMARSLLSDMAKIIFQATVMRSVLSFLGLPTGVGFADGGAFSGGVQKFATGGVFNSPQLFQFAKGGAPTLGMLGEAGPEAILPLKRGADGKLGVASQGGGGGTAVQTNNFNITVQGSTGDQQKDDAYLGKLVGALRAELDARIDQRMFDHMRYGGAFSPRGA